MMKHTLTPFLAVQAAANYLKLGKRTLDNMRWMATGSAFGKHGGRISCHTEEVQRWSEASQVLSTSEY